MIKYKKMNLFDAPEGSVLVHACNAQGVWGSGIAVEFKKRFPYSFEIYQDKCQNEIPFYLTGTAIHIYDDNVVCLMTSENYGDKKDSVDKILIQTTLALKDALPGFINQKIYSNKFNSGLFGVLWEETEKILQYFVKRYNLDWTVCDPNLK